MANYVKTLKEDNGDVTYPVTKAGAVYLNSGTDAESKFATCVTAQEIAVTSAGTPLVGTNMISDKAVTADKIDWTTMNIIDTINTEYVDYNATSGTNSGSFNIGNLLIQYGQITGGSSTVDVTVTFPKSFQNATYTLVVTPQYAEAGSSFWWGFVTSKTTSSFNYRDGYTSITATGGGGNQNCVINWIAIGIAGD